MIRPVQDKDLPAINDLLHQVLTVHADGRPDIFIHGTKKHTDEELLALFHDKTRPIFVAVDEEDTAIGHAFCVWEETRGINNMHDMKTLYIDDICVDEAHRGQHVAKELYEYVRAYAKAGGAYHITLNVWELNPGAKKFYEAMGLSPMKTTMEELL